jgi:hypothetical protein
MSAAKHTPTPWRFDAVKRGTLNMRDGKQSEMRAAGYAITATEPAMFGGTRVLDDAKLREADAAFIVRACNAHAELVAALRKARGALADPAADERSEGYSGIASEALDAIVTALKQAGQA